MGDDIRLSTYNLLLFKGLVPDFGVPARKGFAQALAALEASARAPSPGHS
jgi:hypothetical protein